MKTKAKVVLSVNFEEYEIEALITELARAEEYFVKDKTFSLPLSELHDALTNMLSSLPKRS